MELRHLRYFVAVAERLNFTAAAESLGVSQPPLSQQIRDLEAEIGAELFERTSRRVVLTRAGVDLLERSRGILAQAQEAAERARAIGSGSAGIIKIGLTGSVLTGPIGELIRLFRSTHGPVEVRIHELPPDQQIAHLKARLVDLCFQRSPPHDPDLVTEIAWHERVGVVMAGGHALSRAQRLALTDLAGQPYLSLRLRDSRFANDLWRAGLAAGFAPDPCQEVVEATSLMSLAAAGLGIALIPEFASILRHPKAAFRVLAPPVPAADVHAIRLNIVDAVVDRFLGLMRDRSPGIADALRGEVDRLNEDAPDRGA
ncbi:LysR family transcriptional regulator [Methylobacterium oryzisoli]|uniref:LysR family transcriptional regulator n=1 Tax=Methylobacterium oryzisoli TaxID=3385502 RepID=UPI003891BC06